jgi:two-component system OmpR family response regulator
MPSALNRISYVEDEPDIRSIAAFALTQLGGFTVDLCDSGQQAIEKMPAFAPDIILLDVMMPVMDGIEAFKRLTELPALRATPVVFMTAKAMPQEISSYLSMGAADVIAKPFDPITLPNQLRTIWDRIQQESAAAVA